MVYQVKDKADFEKQLLDAGSKLVVVDFFATWCGPCKTIGPVLQAMSAEMGDVCFLKVDVDECEDIAADYQISAMPTFVLIKNKEKIESFAGANEQKLRDLIVAKK